ncbi:MAG: hypothetical protein ACOXZR_00025 [Bacilli bacterium]|jgi:arabinofuranosyltransferase
MKKAFLNFKKQSIEKKILVIFFVALVITIIGNAWLCDDAYITFRVVDNFINGYGLRWNTFERVQVYSNPLLLFCLSFFSFFTREIYYTSLIFSIVVSSLAVYILVFKVSKNYIISCGICLILILSRSFISYTTSGLENCLTFLLLVIYYYYYFKCEIFNEKGLFKMSLIASFALVNRLDSILLFLPSLIYIFLFKRENKIKFGRMLLIGFMGMFPFILWEVFSIIYYGFPFPNTAYAKLGTSIPTIQYIVKGIKYFIANFLFDPITLLCIVFVFFIVVFNKKKKYYISLGGVLIYLIYIIKIGGDFMNGRFFTAPLFLSLIIVAVVLYEYKNYIVLFLMLSILICFQNLFYQMYEGGISGAFSSRMIKGIENERAIYFKNTGLKNNLQVKSLSDYSLVQKGIAFKKDYKKINTICSIGFIGYYAGPKAKIIDFLALSDSLLARMPIRDNQVFGWRIGHIFRVIPDGYIETIQTGRNQIKDRNIKKYYNKLRIITQDKIFSKKRFKVIIDMNLGKYNYLIRK